MGVGAELAWFVGRRVAGTFTARQTRALRDHDSWHVCSDHNRDSVDGQGSGFALAEHSMAGRRIGRWTRFRTARNFCQLHQRLDLVVRTTHSRR